MGDSRLKSEEMGRIRQRIGKLGTKLRTAVKGQTDAVFQVGS